VSTHWTPADPITELRFALAEADTQTPAAGLRDRMVAAAMLQRRPGMPVRPADHISGLQAFRRMASRLASLLTELDRDEWTQPAVRGLDVQGLVGHLIGVEDAFAAALHGDTSAAEADHVESTQPSALRHAGRPTAETRQEWVSAVERTIARAGDEPDIARPMRFHGIGLPLDAYLVARSFELWTHDEDIRRSTGRPLVDPDPETLTRMTDLAMTLLPAGVSRSGEIVADATARLVLTGPGGGSWDVPLRGERVARARPGRRCDAHVVVDVAAFCRVVANRSDLAGSGAVARADPEVARALFAGAAALAFD
jgi:uncharacterized protein (TIGR03083 family)